VVLAGGLVATAACGDDEGSGGGRGGAGSGGSTAGGSDPGGSAGQGGASDPGGASGAPGEGGEGGEAGMPGRTDTAVINECSTRCDSEADCGFDTPLNDADNYRCEDGLCVPLGCLGDEECDSERPGFVCRSLPGHPRPSCVRACESASDCSAGSPALDDDNFECDDGACAYSGCTGDAECEDLLGTPEATCADPGDGLRGCFAVCEDAGDCPLALPIGTAENFRCDDGLCIYLGCQGDTECTDPLDACVVL
jgi:hypothetical protein